MRIEEALATRLRADGAVTALAGARIWAQAAVQATSDAYVLYELVGERGEHTHSEAGGLWRARVSYACHAARYYTAKELAAAVRTSLDGFRGSLGGVDVGMVLSEELVDLYDEVLKQHVIVVDFQIMYTG